jgi:hypothetical protein
MPLNIESLKMFPGTSYVLPTTHVNISLTPHDYRREKLGNGNCNLYDKHKRTEQANRRIRKIQSFVAMVHNTQNHWVSRLCPSPGILNRHKTHVSET